MVDLKLADLTWNDWDNSNVLDHHPVKVYVAADLN